MREWIVAATLLVGCAAQKKPAQQSAPESPSAEAFGMYCPDREYVPCDPDHTACEQAYGDTCSWVDELYCYDGTDGPTCYATLLGCENPEVRGECSAR